MAAGQIPASGRAPSQAHAGKASGAKRSMLSRALMFVAIAGLTASALTLAWAGPLTPFAKAASTGGCDAGCVYAWGANNVHQTDTQATTPNGVVAVSAAGEMGMALTWDGRVFAWGDDNSGQTEVPMGLSGVKAIAAGGMFGAALKSDGSVLVWGDKFNSTHVTAVPAAAKSGVVAIAAGLGSVFALKSNGTIVAWGSNGYGQLNTPAVALKSISASGQVLGLKADGTVVAWGWNHHGQATVPSGLSGVTAVAAGFTFSAALLSNGSIAAWGDNSVGQLNVPCKLYNFATKTCVQMVTGFTAIAAGDDFGLGLKSDGSVVTWGDNSHGQTTFPSNHTNSGTISIAAGSDFSVGVWRKPGAPAAPGNVSASAGDASAQVTFYGTGDEGGAPITISTVTSSPGGKTCTATGDFNGPKSCVVQGLTNGTSYTFTVTSTNGLGTSAPSAASNAVTPGVGKVFSLTITFPPSPTAPAPNVPASSEGAPVATPVPAEPTAQASATNPAGAVASLGPDASLIAAAPAASSGGSGSGSNSNSGGGSSSGSGGGVSVPLLIVGGVLVVVVGLLGGAAGAVFLRSRRAVKG
jgi:hypothetical protein